jgi:hypothetical protein
MFRTRIQREVILAQALLINLGLRFSSFPVRARNCEIIKSAFRVNDIGLVRMYFIAEWSI